MTEMNKGTVLDDLIAHLGAGVDQAAAAVSVERSEAQVIRDDEHDVDSVSEQNEAGDMHAMFQQIDERQKELVDAAKALPREACDTVKPGAIITMDGANYVVGIAVDEFTSSGTTFEGISSQAPIYDAIAGKKAGETFEFNGTTSTITDVC